MGGTPHPFELLAHLEARCRAKARPLPQRTEVKDRWPAIGFRIEAVRYVAPLRQVSEILHLPRLTPVPGTQPWMRGVANVRGTLLPVMDLKDYLGQGAVPQRKGTRLLVVREEDLAVGLVVDEVLGLRHFRDDQQVLTKPQVPEGVRRYVQGVYRQEDQLWHVFSLHALAHAPEFYRVAV